MVDPVTAIRAATAAFSLIKKGFDAGRDIESMYSDMGRWMGAVSDIKKSEEYNNTNRSSNGKTIKSVAYPFMQVNNLNRD